MPRRMVHLDDDTLDHLEQIARIRHVSLERAMAQCIHEAYRALSIGELVADQTPHLWAVATDAVILGTRA